MDGSANEKKRESKSIPRASNVREGIPQDVLDFTNVRLESGESGSDCEYVVGNGDGTIDVFFGNVENLGTDETNRGNVGDSGRDFKKTQPRTRSEKENVLGKTNLIAIYVSFYSPSEMTNIPYVSSKKIIGLFTLLSFFLATLKNCAIWMIKHLMRFSNYLTVKMTKDERYPDATFSHVEISTLDSTYFVKWGSNFQRISGRLLSPNNYGVVCVVLSKEDYDTVVGACESACDSNIKFNYVGSVINFVLPEIVRNRLFEGGVYSHPEKRFCSEFISEALGKTEAFSPYFGCEEGKILPQLSSPVNLFSVLMDYREKNPSRVTISNYNLKPAERKKKNVELKNRQRGNDVV